MVVKLAKMNNRALYEHYHSNLKLQKRIVPENDFTNRNLIRLLRTINVRDKRVLDVGCGPGTVDFYIASKCKYVIGIDVSKRVIKVASLNSKLLGLSGKTKFYEMKFPTQSPRGKFDLILLTEVLEHLPNDKKAIRTAWSLLGKNGLLIVSVPSINAPLHKIGYLKTFDNEVGHLRRYSEINLRDLLMQGGFDVVSVRKTEGVLRNFFFTNRYAGKFIRFFKKAISDLVTFLDNLLIPLFGESQIYILAKKK